MRTRLALLLLILPLAAWFLWPREAVHSEGAVTAAPASASARAPNPEPHATRASAVPVIPPIAVASAAAEAPAEAAWRRRDADWCARASTLPVDPFELKDDLQGQALSTLLHQELNLSGERYWNELLQRLRARADLASQAIADFVAHRTEPAGQARLLDLALRGDDPFVAALAAQATDCGYMTDCARPGAKRWQALEPDNLIAWLVDPPNADAAAADWDLYLDRLAQARRANTYRSELMQRLWEVDGELDSGIRRVTRGTKLTEFFGMLVPLAPSRGLLDLCAFKANEGQRKERCAQVAERLWQVPQQALIDRVMAVVMAGASGLRDERWKQRAAETEAAMAWHSDKSAGIALETLFRELNCTAGAAGEALQRERIRLGEAQSIVAAMRAAGADERAYSEKYRSKRKEGMLRDRLPPRAPAKP